MFSNGSSLFRTHHPEEAVFLPGKMLERNRLFALAHITNSMATREDYFEKGNDTGTQQALDICAIALTAALEHEGGYPSHEEALAAREAVEDRHDQDNIFR